MSLLPKTARLKPCATLHTCILKTIAKVFVCRQELAILVWIPPDGTVMKNSKQRVGRLQGINREKQIKCALKREWEGMEKDRLLAV